MGVLVLVEGLDVVEDLELDTAAKETELKAKSKTRVNANIRLTLFLLVDFHIIGEGIDSCQIRKLSG